MSASGKGSNLRPTAYMAAALPLSYRRSGIIFAGSCAAIIALSGCATLDAKVAVPVSCLATEPPAMPQTATEAEILAMTDYAATLTVYTERLLLKAYGAKAEALLIGCR